MEVRGYFTYFNGGSKYPHAFYLGLMDGSVPAYEAYWKEYAYVQEWCIEQFGHDEDRWKASSNNFYFVSEKDAAIFKLRWL